MEIHHPEFYRKFYIYRNEKYYYILSINKKKDCCAITEIQRNYTPQNNTDLLIKKVQKLYDFKTGLKTIAKLIQRNNNPKLETSQCLSKSFVTKCYGIIGYPKFLDGHYLHIITKRKHVGSVLGSKIYQLIETKLEMVMYQTTSCLYKLGKQRSQETKYLGMFNTQNSEDFYFSYELDLTQSFSSLVDHCSEKQKFDKRCFKKKEKMSRGSTYNSVNADEEQQLTKMKSTNSIIRSRGESRKNTNVFFKDSIKNSFGTENKRTAKPEKNMITDYKIKVSETLSESNVFERNAFDHMFTDKQKNNIFNKKKNDELPLQKFKTFDLGLNINFRKQNRLSTDVLQIYSERDKSKDPANKINLNKSIECLLDIEDFGSDKNEEESIHLDKRINQSPKKIQSENELNNLCLKIPIKDIKSSQTTEKYEECNSLQSKIGSWGGSPLVRNKDVNHKHISQELCNGSLIIEQDDEETTRNKGLKLPIDAEDQSYFSGSINNKNLDVKREKMSVFSFATMVNNSKTNIQANLIDNFYPLNINDFYAWNTYNLQPLLKNQFSREFMMPIICGSFRLKVIEIEGRYIQMGVMSRRSRYNTGISQFKEGINYLGYVGNEIETEIFLQEIDAFSSEIKYFSSYLMLRGSAPFFWEQNKNSYGMKSEVIINQEKVDPNYKATKKHFDRLLNTYKGPIIILNLLKKDNDKETHLGKLYEKYFSTFLDNKLIAFVDLDQIDDTTSEINLREELERNKSKNFDNYRDVKEHKLKPDKKLGFELTNTSSSQKPNLTNNLQHNLDKHSLNQNSASFKDSTSKLFYYMWFDFAKIYNESTELLTNYFHKFGNILATKTSFNFYDFTQKQEIYQHPGTPKHIMEEKFKQKGVIRANCKDCLDHTGNAQMLISVYKFIEMLSKFGFDLSDMSGKLYSGIKNELFSVIFYLFNFNSEKLMKQFTGSAIHDSVKFYKNKKGDLNFYKKNSKSLAMNISSATKDSELQKMIWLYLGDFIPKMNEKCNLWELNTFTKEVENHLVIRYDKDNLDAIPILEADDENSSSYSDFYSEKNLKKKDPQTPISQASPCIVKEPILNLRIRVPEILPYLKMDLEKMFYHRKNLPKKLNYIEESSYLEEDLKEVVLIPGIKSTAKPDYKSKASYFDNNEEASFIHNKKQRENSQLKKKMRSDAITENAIDKYNEFLKKEIDFWEFK